MQLNWFFAFSGLLTGVVAILKSSGLDSILVFFWTAMLVIASDAVFELMGKQTVDDLIIGDFMLFFLFIFGRCRFVVIEVGIENGGDLLFVELDL